ncbi:hypothetical protein HA075_15325 [bacterium BFN5]|nr:hypothetical protein HA075_15325 [bacterium BFN5]
MINPEHVYEAIWHTLISFVYLLFLTRIMGRNLKYHFIKNIFTISVQTMVSLSQEDFHD